VKSLIKLKINHKVETGTTIPWELIYLIKKDELELGKKLFKYYLIVTEDAQVKDLLSVVNFNSFGVFGIDRQSIVTDTLRPPKQLRDLITIEDYCLIIPLLSKGKKSGKKTLRYFSSKRFRRVVNSENSSGSKNAPKCMPKVIISAGENLEGHPCVNCENLHKKLMDDRACHLGSTACLSSILIGSGSDFNTSLNIVEGM